MTLHVWDGISVYRTATQERNKARDHPFLGRFIAELSIPDDAPIRVEKTYGRGHHTVWGAADILLTLVVSVTPVEMVE